MAIVSVDQNNNDAVEEDGWVYKPQTPVRLQKINFFKFTCLCAD